MQLLVLLLSLVGLVFSQPVSIPKTNPGFSIGDRNAPVTVDIFVDLLCSDCKANWPTWKSVIDQYTPNGKVYFTYHLFPLPYHPFSFRASQGAYVLRAMNGTSAAIRYMDEIINNQAAYSGPSMNDATVMNKMVDLVGYLGYDRHIFQAGINNSQYNVATRVGWKYGASRYATGTPHILINQLPADHLLEDGKFNTWKSVLDPLLA